MKIVLGAGTTQFDGWISTQQDQLDLLKPETFEAFFQVCGKIVNIKSSVYVYLSIFLFFNGSY